MKQNDPEIKYPVGIQNFEKIRTGGFLYVDKTASIYSLIKNDGYYFLSRPRRFGKSLLLSTLEAYFLGQRSLFKGLALDTLTEEWEAHPVLHLDLNNGTFTQATDLHVLLEYQLREWEDKYGISRDDDLPALTLSVRFARVIRRAAECTGKKVVILVDEYDKPLLNAVESPRLLEVYRAELKGFYSNLKNMDRYIRIAVLTGVARFSKVSIFSDLNNLRDISFEKEFSNICGITAEELSGYFKDGIAQIARNEDLSIENVMTELQRNYDGYHFSSDSPDIYNPFSLINAFAKGEIGDYWFRSATPEFLVKLVRHVGLPFHDIAPAQISRNELEDGGLLSPDCIPAFYQTGYLTIKDFDRKNKIFTLDYPNIEVKEGFLRFLTYSYLPQI